MPWQARLRLDYRMEAGRCVGRFEHEGPLRVLQSLYPEGDAICHHVLVHPPGGLVGGDTLDVSIDVGPGAHGLVTTPGASRFYRSDGEVALARTHIRVRDGGHFEWLPLEALCYSGCIAQNHLTLQVDAGAELIGWDVTALGLPSASLPFVQGSLLQHIELPGHWLERGLLSASDTRLLDGPLGLAGQRCMATLFLAAGDALGRERRERALDLAREAMAGHSLETTAGATAPNARVVVVRVLAPLVEPAMELLRRVRAAWRMGLWDLPATVPRTWAL